MDGRATVCSTTGWRCTEQPERVPLMRAVIPEPVFTRDEYENGLLRSLGDQIAPLDLKGTLQHEWLNAGARSRGSIAARSRSASST